MKTRHIIAIGLLSATAIGILAIGIKTNKKQANQTNATSYIENVTKNNDKYNYEITGTNTANYTQANATNYYQFQYNWHLAINNTTNTIVTGSIELVQLITDQNAQDWINQTITINEDFLASRILWDANFTQKSFTINNTYEITTTIELNLRYKNNSLDRVRDRKSQYTFTYTSSNPYTTIENTEQQTFEIYNIHNNLQTIQTFANNQYQTGYNDGIEYVQEEIPNAYTEGYTDGKEYGYATGYNDSEAFNHPIALQPLMLQILTMPFTFLSKAFDVTLWPGTQYEFNIANFIKGLIAIATILFIIKIFTTGFAIFGNYTGSIQNHRLTKSQIEYNKAKTDLTRRTDPNNKTRTSTSHNTNVNINKKG